MSRDVVIFRNKETNNYSRESLHLCFFIVSVYNCICNAESCSLRSCNVDDKMLAQQQLL